MTNATKTVGGAIASAVFAIALTATGSIDGSGQAHAPLSGYLTVWAVCAGAALLAAVALLVAPEHAFADPRVTERSGQAAQQPGIRRVVATRRARPRA